MSLAKSLSAAKPSLLALVSLAENLWIILKFSAFQQTQSWVRKNTKKYKKYVTKKRTKNTATNVQDYKIENYKQKPKKQIWKNQNSFSYSFYFSLVDVVFG